MGVESVSAEGVGVESVSAEGVVSHADTDEVCHSPTRVLLAALESMDG